MATVVQSDSAPQRRRPHDRQQPEIPGGNLPTVTSEQVADLVDHGESGANRTDTLAPRSPRPPASPGARGK